MKIDHFDPPGNNSDFVGNPALAKKWSAKMSQFFDEGVSRANGAISAGGTCQFYNPVTHGLTAPDLPPADIAWNGFPRKFLGSGPGVPPKFDLAEPPAATGVPRDQDEYLEWYANKDTAEKITAIHFTCEGYDYYQFLGAEAPDILVALYQKFISPAVAKADLFSGGIYDVLNHWNTRDAAMHLTHGANALEAEVLLGGDATVRRKNSAGVEVTSPDVLCTCGAFGDPRRNSDPAIGAGVNALVRQGRMITLANPVGLYIDHIDDASFRLPDGSATNGWFQIVRGSPGHTLRAIFAPPAGSPFIVSDVKIGGTPVKFGGQIAQKITMKLTGVASASNTIHNAPVPCVVPVGTAHLTTGAAPKPKRPTRGGN
ncbi:MAG: hypothetical protein HY040_06860 [Planctomycetes bacterium]|nr:hypothetical protein [Planctomycetota bacterium]